MKVLIADDHQLIVEGFKVVILKEHPTWEVYEAYDLENVLDVLNNNSIDIIFQDIRFGKDDARIFIPDIKLKFPNLKIIIITSYSDAASTESLFKMGIDGYLLKTDMKNEIFKAINMVSKDEKFISEALREARQGKRVNYKQDIILTPRETEILSLVIAGKTTKEISDNLSLSEKTIESHRANLFLKFEVNNVASLVRKAILEGYL